jgi:hypothetical protein
VSSRLRTLAERRQALIVRSDQERDEVAGIFGGFERKLAVVETVIATARRLHRHRALVGAAAVGLVFAPLAARKWLGRAIWLVPLALEGHRLARDLDEERRTSPRGDAPAGGPNTP